MSRIADWSAIACSVQVDCSKNSRLSRARRARVNVHCQKPAITDAFEDTKVPNIVPSSPRIVLIGGTGRVGSSTASALLETIPDSKLILGSRTVQSYKNAIERRRNLVNSSHVLLDVDQPSTIEKAIDGADLVVHTAGPFQRREKCAVLEAAIKKKVPYVDVCDDTEYSKEAKRLHLKAIEAGIPAIITGGIYPGLSNVMAAHMIDTANETNNGGMSRESEPKAAPSRVLYSYFTAGSGGAGPTILETTFLLAGEPVVAYKDNSAVTLPPVSNRRVVDFGKGVGKRSVYLYSLPEVSSGHDVFGVPNISARFGTSPEVWNWAMVALARFVPRGILEDPKAVQGLAKLTDPLVRAVDQVVGEQVAMLIEVEFEDKKIAAGLFVHDKLSESVGKCTGAFAHCMLAGHTQPGVWFPEEREALLDRQALFKLSQVGAKKFSLNKSPWELESEPIQLGFGIYIE